jgi:hypothetical protein
MGCRDRSRRRLFLGASLTLGAALAGALGASAGAASPACGPAGSRTVVASKRAVIFHSRGGAFYGCLAARGKPVFLALDTLPLGTPHVAGPFAAFSRPAHHDGATDEDVPATVLSIGLCRSDGRRFKYNRAAGDSVSDLVLSRYGDVAWIARQGGTYRVAKLDASTTRTRPVTVAESGAIAPRSLTLKSGRISWRDGTARHSARLRPLRSTCRP